MDFTPFVATLSSRFINVRVDQIEPLIDASLRELVQTMQVGRAILAEFAVEGVIQVTHSYSVPGFHKMAKQIVDEDFPWFAREVRAGRVVQLSSRAQLPLGAVKEHQFALIAGIHSNLTVPFAVGAMPLMALAVECGHEREWTAHDLRLLRLVGEILANAIARKRWDENLQTVREEYAHMSRVATVGQLATSIAHEINQPICSIVNNAYAASLLLEHPAPDVAEIRAALQQITEDARRAGDVIGKAHAMLKRQKIEFRPLSLNDLATGVQRLLASFALLRQVEVRSQLDPSLPYISGHAVQLQQVITNLLVNAVEATSAANPAERRVTITTTFDADTRRVAVLIADNGNGISTELATRVFEPFYTTKENGLGMGLAVARDIVLGHGGELWIERYLPSAVFAFSIPVIEEDS